MCLSLYVWKDEYFAPFKIDLNCWLPCGIMYHPTHFIFVTFGNYNELPVQRKA